MNYGIHNLSIDMFADFDASAGATTAAGANTSTGTNHNLSTLHEFEESLLDLTLQEMADDDAPATSATSRPATVLWDAWKNASLANMCGPALRSFLLHKAATLCDAADEASPPVLAVMYETAALSIWTLWKFQSVLPQQRRGKPVTKDTINNVTSLTAASTGNKLLDFCRATNNNAAAATKLSGPDPPTPVVPAVPEPLVAPTELRSMRDKLTVTEDMLRRCRQLPTTWTVLQLCKRYNPRQAIQTAAERFGCPLPLHLTVLAGARGDLLDDSDAPLRVTIPPNSGAEDDAAAATANFFQLAYDTSQEINSEQRRRTASAASNLEGFCSRLRRFLGPWLALFCGRARSQRAQRIDTLAFRAVDRHCTSVALRFSRRQLVLASLLARAVSLLDRDALLAGAQHIATTEEQYAALVAVFLHHVPVAVATVAGGGGGVVEAGDYHPTVLIVDELVDFVYWEMAVPQLQQTRISSLALLFRLADQYAGRLRRDGAGAGVLPVPVHRGLVLSNPDNTLAGSGQRMQLLFDRLRPQYRTICGRAPQADEMQAALAAADVYVYAGHGNGLQFVGGRELADTELHAVAFLYGCESVALKAVGGQSEPVGAHLYLQYALCPAVVGMLNVTTDVWTDIATLGLTSMWLGGGSEWPDDELEAFVGEWDAVRGHRTTVYADATRLMLAKRPRPELLAVLQEVRCTVELPLRLRMALVARGLPVCVEGGPEAE